MDTKKSKQEVKSRKNNGVVVRERNGNTTDPVASLNGNDVQTKLEARFIESQSNLSASRRRLLLQILEEPHETFFLSSRELARRFGVDSATIVRTVQAMGYLKFADFVYDLRNHFVTQITPYTAMKAATQKNRSVADHVHVLCRLGKTMSMARLVKELKRESSKWAKTKAGALADFYWQNGYGAFSVSPAHVEPLRVYIANQEEHHRKETFQDELRRLLTKYGLQWDERYVWD